MTLWLLLSLSSAYADAVAPPPPSCPDGSRGYSDHAGARCVPHRCADTPCPDGTCVRTGLCASSGERPCGGRTGKRCTYLHEEASGPCGDDGTCSSGTCVVDTYCMPQAPAPPPVPDAPVTPLEGSLSCGGCSSAVSASAVLFAGMLPLLFGLARRRSAR